MRDIVVGIDGSGSSRHALDRALRLGQLTGRRVTVVHAWSPPLPVNVGLGAGYLFDGIAALDNVRVAARQLLDAEVAAGVQRLGDAPGVTVRAVLEEGFAGAALAHAADKAAFVVLGTRAHGRVSAILGTTVPHVLHHVECPVMVVPEGSPFAQPFRRVVVGVDGSESSRAALRWALDVAHRSQAEIEVVHVANKPLAADEPWRGEVERALVGTGVTLQVIPARSPADALLASVGSTDLLVVGSRGAGGFAGLVLGSVSAHCVSNPFACVAVIRAHQERLDDLTVASGTSRRTR